MTHDAKQTASINPHSPDASIAGGGGWRDTRAYSAPKDGSVFWAYLYSSGARLMRWHTAAGFAELEGGDEADYDDAYVLIDDASDAFEPRWWLPLNAIPVPPDVKAAP